MKKVLSLMTVILLSTTFCYGATNTLKQQIKSDVQKSRADLKSAIKADVENNRKANQEATNNKKQQKIKKTLLYYSIKKSLL